MGTAARGDDLANGSEVKSCSRADQLSECKDCGAKVLVWEEKCSECDSDNINIKTDSHWIFAIKSEEELDLLLNKIPRIILILFDKKEGSDDIKLRAWTVDPKNEYVIEFFKDYFYNNYMKKDNPAPCNLHPLKYDFYMMRPMLMFHSEINIEDNDVNIIFWDINNPKNESMPTTLLNKNQLIDIFGDDVSKLSKKEIISKFKDVPIGRLNKLVMKEKKTKTYKKKYLRR